MATPAQPAPRDHPERGSDPLAALLASAFRSARLTYRSVEATDDDLLFRLRSDVGLHSSASWPRPFTRDGATGFRKNLQEALIAAVIEVDDHSEEPAKSVPIGVVCLRSCFGPDVSQNRTAELAINIFAAYHGRGYGSEASRWVVDWAFNMAGLHRIRLCCFSYNTRAIRAYEAVGFERTGVEKEALWLGGKYWDFITYGILDRDWARLKEEGKVKGLMV